MASGKQMTPLDKLAEASPATAQTFQELRKAVLASGPLDGHTCELIVLGAMATRGYEAGFKTHARRLLKEKVDPAKIRQAVLVTLAATTAFSEVSAALRWVEEVVAEG